MKFIIYNCTQFLNLIVQLKFFTYENFGITTNGKCKWGCKWQKLSFDGHRIGAMTIAGIVTTGGIANLMLGGVIGGFFGAASSDCF